MSLMIMLGLCRRSGVQSVNNADAVMMTFAQLHVLGLLVDSSAENALVLSRKRWRDGMILHVIMLRVSDP